MDVISRTFLPATTEAGVVIPSRHLPIVERCVDADDDAVLVARCTRPEAPLSGDHLLLLTRRRLVVIQKTPVLHRLRLHLNANLRHLSNVTWRPDLTRPALEMAATAVDGVRERFRMKFADTEAVWRFEGVLRDVFLA
ncbi:hypothetical protein BJY16_001464 [Actinoplanes octamycinicus]|uniref:Uncharacterized protein n=1 Tax=Actinoplanes octamycinicus TaxID=135948 RepID=A0A7W7GTI6_9ACTN|nr:hypothetical protein [Actinoplanes octamycinicus]MBB4738005.1 hypothetical protein [Actinoplanes octamycinicus]GIE58945.1 hypothetical protein Aoc01nite_43470 [Actinoplanes octamycinicus]